MVEKNLNLVLYKNLLVLGMLHPHSSRLIPFVKENLLNDLNKPAVEQILYYLLNIIEPKKCKEIRWPLWCEKDSVEFRKKAKVIISAVIEEHPGSNIPRVTPYLLMTYKGARMNELLCRLSVFALKCIRREFGENSTQNSVPGMTVGIDLTGQHLRTFIRDSIRLEYILETSLQFAWRELEEKRSADRQLKEKLLELAKVLELCPVEFRPSSLSLEEIERGILDWDGSVSRMEALNSEDISESAAIRQTLRQLKSLLTNGFSSPQVLDFAKYEGLLKTEHVAKLIESTDMQLYKDRGVSLENLLLLTNVTVNRLRSIMVTQNDIQRLVTKNVLPADKILDGVLTRSIKLVARISLLNDKLVESCKQLNNYLSNNMNRSYYNFPNLMESPQIDIPTHLNQEFNDSLQEGESITPVVRLQECHKRLETETEADKFYSRLDLANCVDDFFVPSESGLRLGMITPGDRRHTIDSPRARPCTTSSRFRSRPTVSQSLFRTVISQQQHRTPPSHTRIPEESKMKHTTPQGHWNNVKGNKCDQSSDSFRDLLEMLDSDDSGDEFGEAKLSSTRRNQEEEDESAPIYSPGLQSIIDRYKKFKEKINLN